MKMIRALLVCFLPFMAVIAGIAYSPVENILNLAVPVACAIVIFCFGADFLLVKERSSKLTLEEAEKIAHPEDSTKPRRYLLLVCHTSIALLMAAVEWYFSAVLWMVTIAVVATNIHKTQWLAERRCEELEKAEE